MLIPKVSMQKFVEYGFKPCKKPYEDCYYLCISKGIKMIFVSPVCFMINDWEKDDPRIHKNPNCRYRDNRTAEDILFDLIKKDMLDCEVG